MEMKKEIKDSFRKVFFFLALPENRNTEFPFDDLLDQLKIPKSQSQTLWHHIWFHSPKIVTTSKPSPRNVPIKINQYGIELAERMEEKWHQEQIRLYPSRCNKVLRYITTKDKEHIELTTPDISKALDIDYDTCEAIADEFRRRQLIELSSTDGHYIWHVLPDAHSFVRSRSFENEMNLMTPIVYQDHSTHTYGDNSPLTLSTTVQGDGNIVGGTQSSDNNLTKERTETTKTTSETAPKNKSLSSKIIKVIITVLTIITSLIAVYEFILKHIFHTQSLF